MLPPRPVTGATSPGLLLQDRSQGEEVKSRHREPKDGGGGGAAVGMQNPSAWVVALQVQVQEQMVASRASASLCHILSYHSDLNKGSGGSPQE